MVEERRMREREIKYEEKVGLALFVKLSNRDHNFSDFSSYLIKLGLAAIVLSICYIFAIYFFFFQFIRDSLA